MIFKTTQKLQYLTVNTLQIQSALEFIWRTGLQIHLNFFIRNE